MKKYTLLAATAILSIGLVGCNGAVNNQDMGTLGGAALGGLLGSQFGGGSGRILAAVGGTLLGGYLGNRVGASMDQTDQLRMQQAMNSGQSQAWTNSNTGQHYQMTPGPAVSSNCRDYTMTASVDGKKTPVHGTACKQNGQWVVNQG